MPSDVRYETVGFKHATTNGDNLRSTPTLMVLVDTQRKHPSSDPLRGDRLQTFLARLDFSNSNEDNQPNDADLSDDLNPPPGTRPDPRPHRRCQNLLRMVAPRQMARLSRWDSCTRLLIDSMHYLPTEPKYECWKMKLKIPKPSTRTPPCETIGEAEETKDIARNLGNVLMHKELARPSIVELH